MVCYLFYKMLSIKLINLYMKIKIKKIYSVKNFIQSNYFNKNYSSLFIIKYNIKF